MVNITFPFGTSLSKIFKMVAMMPLFILDQVELA